MGNKGKREFIQVLRLLEAMPMEIVTFAVTEAIHIGAAGFDAVKLKENVEALIADLKRIKPASSKGIYVKRVTLSTTMGPGLVIDQGSLDV